MMGSIQEKLLRVRPPRVKITYDVETGGAIEKLELPFIVGIFADLAGEPEGELPPVKDRKLVDIDRDNFDKVMAKIGPRVTLSSVPDVLSDSDDDDKQPHLSGALVFSSLEDFGPRRIVDKIPRLQALYQGRTHIRGVQAKAEASDALGELLDQAVTPGDKGDALRNDLKTAFGGKPAEEWVKADSNDTLDSLLSPGNMVLDDSQRDMAMTMLGQFYQDIVADLPDDNRHGANKLIDLRVKEIDEMISAQLNEVMHLPAFQRLEATWRGMFYLVSRAETGRMLKLRVINVSKQDLLKDLQKAVEFDQSAVFKMIYEAEYGSYGGMPYSLLVGDYEFGRGTADMALLAKMSEIAASAHAPFISAAYAKLFDLQSFEHLAKPRDLGKIFESLELIEWQSFRQSEDSRYVTLTLPRVLLRLPYGEDTVAVEGLDFEEDVSGYDAGKFLWGNSAYVLAERITNAFSLYSWTAAIRGVNGGGLVEGLPSYTFKTNEGDVGMVCPTQVQITDRREKELNDLGFMAICHCKGTNKAAFFGGQTTNLPRKYISDDANSNAALSARLPYILAASRFAHYIKVLMRERVGSFMTAANVESFLNSWIAQYVLLDDDASQDVKAAYPLREAKVVVTEVPGSPGAYNATVFLKPHFQLEELSTSIRLVAKLPS